MQGKRRIKQLSSSNCSRQSYVNWRCSSTIYMTSYVSKHLGNQIRQAFKHYVCIPGSGLFKNSFTKINQLSSHVSRKSSNLCADHDDNLIFVQVPKEVPHDSCYRIQLINSSFISHANKQYVQLWEYHTLEDDYKILYGDLSREKKQQKKGNLLSKSETISHKHGILISTSCGTSLKRWAKEFYQKLKQLDIRQVIPLPWEESH